MADERDESTGPDDDAEASAPRPDAPERDPDADADADQAGEIQPDEILADDAPADDAPGDAASGDADSFEIVEQTPAPLTGDESEPTSVDVDPVPAAPPPPPAQSTVPPAPPAPPVPLPPEPAAAPPVSDPAPPVEESSGGWPGAAKAIVAILAVVAVAGIVASIIGFSRASSAEDDADTRSTQLDEAIARGDTLELQLEETEAARDEVVRENNELVAQRAELLGTLAAAETDRDAALAELEAERARFEDLLTGAAAELEEVQELVEEFPRTVEVDLGAADIGGTYRLEFTEIGCSGLDICGSPPAPIDGTLQTSGGLRLIVPDLLDVPLVVVAGTPFGAADSESLVPPCADVPRPTSLTLALFDDSLEVDIEGDVEVTSLGATVVIDAPEFEECGIGRVWYRVEMTPQG